MPTRTSVLENVASPVVPFRELALDGYRHTSPVTVFPPKGYGVYDLIRNVLEWTSDWYSSRHEAGVAKTCQESKRWT